MTFQNQSPAEMKEKIEKIRKRKGANLNFMGLVVAFDLGMQMPMPSMDGMTLNTNNTSSSNANSNNNSNNIGSYLSDFGGANSFGSTSTNSNSNANTSSHPQINTSNFNSGHFLANNRSPMSPIPLSPLQTSFPGGFGLGGNNSAGNSSQSGATFGINSSGSGSGSLRRFDDFIFAHSPQRESNNGMVGGFSSSKNGNGQSGISMSTSGEGRSPLQQQMQQQMMGNASLNNMNGNSNNNNNDDENQTMERERDEDNATMQESGTIDDLYERLSAEKAEDEPMKQLNQNIFD